MNMGSDDRVKALEKQSEILYEFLLLNKISPSDAIASLIVTTALVAKKNGYSFQELHRFVSSSLSNLEYAWDGFAKDFPGKEMLG